MNITVLTSSPNREGASNTLAGYFVKGAKEGGHTVDVFDLNKMHFHNCIGCYKGREVGHCLMKDDFTEVERSIEKSGMIVYVTPVYYYLMAAPLKAAIDRLHCIEPRLHGMKSLFIATAHREDNQVMQYLVDFYRGLAEYLEYDNIGEIMAKGCYDAATVENSIYALEAYRLGKSLK